MVPTRLQIVTCNRCKGKGYIQALEKGKTITINCTKCGGCQMDLLPLSHQVLKDIHSTQPMER